MRRIFLLMLCLSLVVIPAKAAQQPKYVALTFDDGPSGRFTRRLLDGLQARDAKATFLLCGYRLKDYPKEARRIADEGHEIGIHGYSHDPMNTMTEAQVRGEILATASLLPEGVCPAFLRPPGGQCGAEMCRAAKNLGLPVLNWSLDSRDWATNDAALITRRVVERAKDGDVILMHDMSASSVTAALEIIDCLHARGFRFVTVSELVALKGANLRPGEIYCGFSG